MTRPKNPRNDHQNAPAGGECLYTAALVVCSARRVVAQGALLVREGRVAAVGPRGEFPKRPDCRVVDLGSAAILPGLVNAHAHLEYSSLAGALDRGPFHRWLPEMIRLKRTLTPEQVADGVARGIARMRAAGVTTVADVSTYGIAPAILAQSGLHYGVFHEVISLAKKPGDAFLDEVGERCRASERGAGRQPDFVGIAPHAPYTVSRAVLAALRRRFHAAERRRFCLHVGESRSEVACVKARRGALARLFRRAGFYPQKSGDPGIVRNCAQFALDFRAADGPPDLLVHGSFLRSSEFRAIAAANSHTALVVCPATRIFHGVNRSPFSLARRAEIPLVLGTDSAASGSSLSPWDEMRIARENLSMSATEVWETFTEKAAATLGLEKRRGVLQEQADADFLVISHRCAGDPPTRTFDALNHWLEHTIERICRINNCIQASYVSGKVVL